MSLTVLINEKSSEVVILHRFLDSKASISYATGPLSRISENEFRAKGWELVQKHFELYNQTRITEEMIIPVFKTAAEKNLLKNTVPVRIKKADDGKNFVLVPQRFLKFSLMGLESLDEETYRKIFIDETAENFWRQFDEAFKIAKAANS